MNPIPGGLTTASLLSTPLPPLPGPETEKPFAKALHEHQLIQITDDLAIDERDLEERFVRAPGPGGQKVNKVATAVQLRLDLRGFSELPDDLRQRLIALAGRRVGSNGVLSIEAHRYRSRERNRADAFERLRRLIARAADAPRPRKRRLRPTRAVQERRLEAKRRRAATKRQRKTPPD